MAQNNSDRIYKGNKNNRGNPQTQPQIYGGIAQRQPLEYGSIPITNERDLSMSESMSIKGIESELARLGQTRWMAVFVQLDAHYQGYPLSDESQQPATAIYNILQSLNPDDTPEVRLIHRVQQLDCFSYRAYYINDKHETVYWNPLEESYTHFEQDAKNTTIHYQVEDEYPPSDIIRNWLYNRVKQPQ